MFVLILEILLLLNFGITDTHSLTCNADSLRFAGLLKIGKRSYLPGEGFIATCERGYQPSLPGSKIICRNGSWTGHFPPCIAANCSDSPPPIANGRAKSFTGWHFSTATYECDAPFFLSGQSRVRCLFGEWTGQLPSCRDSRCYPQDFKNSNGIVSIGKKVTSSGDHLDFTCAAGLTPVNFRPLCTNGLWLEQITPPCQEVGCVVKQINNGALTDVEKIKSWRWSKLRRQEKEVLVKVKIGSMKPAGYSLSVQCKPNFFQAEGNSTVKCMRGYWQPDPVCTPVK